MHITLYDIESLLNMLGPNQHQEPPGESRIDKMRKFLSSPLTRKKPNVLHLKTFGTPVETLLQRAPSNHSVPFIITRLCQYIKQTGLTHEGLFRISGNARSVERLRASFDRTGDAPLETEGDVPSAAALLKLFLRELPDPIIPLNMHCQFLNAVKDKEQAESVSCLADLVDNLPQVNYCILSYLSCFLKQVSDLEDQNRMSASSLGIVFGPNLFRVTEDFVGLKEQSLTNQIVTYFITNYQDIFKKETYFSENSDISCTISNSGHQLPTMVSSWPETKGCSSALLSSWSLGPLSIPMHSSDDTYLPLCPVSYSIEQASSTPFALCSKQDETDYSSFAQSEFISKSLTSDYSLHHSEITDKSYEDFSISSSVPCGLENQAQLSHNKMSHSHNYSEIEAELSAALKECSLVNASDSSNFQGQFHPSSSRKNSYEGNSFEENKQYSQEEGEISLRIPSHLSKPLNEEEEKILMDSHKSYPRGRRRHIKHQKKTSDREERRSRSELRATSRFENEDDCNGNTSYLTHSTKLEAHHNSTGTLDESSSELRHSWPAFRKCREDDIALSPLPQALETTQVSEASVSPSAFRNYLSQRNLHLDPNLPPSPPVEQEDLVCVTGNSLEDSASSAKQLTKKVHALKKKIKLFEENFEKLYGYKPTNTEKCNNIAVKKMLAELNKAKQDLRQLKQEPALWSDDDTMINKNSKGTNTHCSQGLFSTGSGGAGTLSIEDSVKEAIEYLVRHRKSENRPEALEEMNHEQLVAEKVLVQKVLLNFESMHGRPSSKAHRELVRPLYDRYRCTKRLIARLSASKDPAELQPIMEHETMDFPAADQAKETDEIRGSKLLSDNVKMPENSQNAEKEFKSTLKPHINFHELSLSELMEELNAVREEKRKIRKILRDFEDQFKKENGRKAQREDKRCMESFYTEYKNAKAKLKLLEALVAKHEQTS